MSSLTVEVEAVVSALSWIALRSDSQTTHAIILTDPVSLLVFLFFFLGGGGGRFCSRKSRDWPTTVFNTCLQRFLVLLSWT